MGGRNFSILAKLGERRPLKSHGSWEQRGRPILSGIWFTVRIQGTVIRRMEGRGKHELLKASLTSAAEAQKKTKGIKEFVVCYKGGGKKKIAAERYLEKFSTVSAVFGGRPGLGGEASLINYEKGREKTADMNQRRQTAMVEDGLLSERQAFRKLPGRETLGRTIRNDTSSRQRGDL